MVDLNGVELTADEEELYDRQIRLWGLESQKRIRAAKILICGLNGLGAEITKNIVLAGVKSVVLLDDKNVSESDGFSQFLIPLAETMGENRAVASLQRARALNPTVEITADKGPLKDKKEEFFLNFDVVIVIEVSTKEIQRVNKLCRANDIKFFSGDVWGMFGYGFTDLQEHEFVEDVVKHKVISQPHEKIRTTKITSTVKRNIKFPSFDTVLNFDYKTVTYMKKIIKSGSWFVLLRVLQTFRDRFERDPDYKTRCEDITELLKIRDEIAKDLVIDDDFVHVFNQISPVAAIVGGEISQEIIKTVSKKEAPHQNVFLFDPDTCCGYIEEIGIK